MDELVLKTFAERPEFIPRVYDLDDTWPEFMGHDVLASALFWQVVPAFPELCVIATDDDWPVARARAIPFSLKSWSPEGELPEGGWDRVLAWGIEDHVTGQQPDTVSALEVAIDARYLGRGLSGRMLRAMREAAAASGYHELVAPVRPNHKHLQPRTPMAEYARLTGDDGLPVDPWLRVHVRAGGVIDKVAPTSMVVTGSLAQWRSWTGLPFDTSGPVEVPEALIPVRCDTTHDQAVYVEPNVWVRHRF